MCVGGQGTRSSSTSSCNRNCHDDTNGGAVDDADANANDASNNNHNDNDDDNDDGGTGHHSNTNRNHSSIKPSS